MVAITLKSIVEDAVHHLGEQLKNEVNVSQERTAQKIKESENELTRKIKEAQPDPRIMTIGIGTDILTIFSS